MPTTLDAFPGEWINLPCGDNNSSRRVLAVSPHLDDAVLSVGATLANLVSCRHFVRVVTLFAGRPVDDLSDIAVSFHRKCGHPSDGSAIRGRRSEDLAAMRILGSDVGHANFLDAVYRRRADGSWLCQHERAMFDTNLPGDECLERELRRHLEDQIRETKPDLVLTCAAVGHHVDHVLTFETTARVLRHRDISLLAWEDLPYALSSPTPGSLKEFSRILVTPSETSWAKKWEAIAAYASQVRMLWGSRDWASILEKHATAQGSSRPAEVLWRVHTGVPGRDSLRLQKAGRA